MIRKIGIILTIAFALVLIGCTQAEQNAQIATGNLGTYTLVEVAEHNNSGDCWIAIDNNVYNITPMLSKSQTTNAINKNIQIIQHLFTK